MGLGSWTRSSFFGGCGPKGSPSAPVEVEVRSLFVEFGWGRSSWWYAGRQRVDPSRCRYASAHSRRTWARPIASTGSNLGCDSQEVAVDTCHEDPLHRIVGEGRIAESHCPWRGPTWYLSIRELGPRPALERLSCVVFVTSLGN